MPAANSRPARHLTIGDLAQSADCQIDTVRYYERMGLMPKAARSEGGQRRYTDEDAKRLLFIRRMRDLGFGLKEINQFLERVERRSYACSDFRRAMQARIADARRRIAELRRLERLLNDMAAQCGDATLSNCRIIDRLFDADRDIFPM